MFFLNLQPAPTILLLQLISLHHYQSVCRLGHSVSRPTEKDVSHLEWVISQSKEETVVMQNPSLRLLRHNGSSLLFVSLSKSLGPIQSTNF